MGCCLRFVVADWSRSLQSHGPGSACVLRLLWTGRSRHSGLAASSVSACWLQETRDFFRSFFSLSAFHWQGFLSARLSFLELIGFGLSLFIHASTPARLNLLRMGVPGLAAMVVELIRIGF